MDTHCPFCISPLNPGASTCAACGAYFRPPLSKAANVVFVLMGLPIILIGLVLVKTEGAGGYFVAALGVLYSLVMYGHIRKDKGRWIRRVR
jgi:hypothetical protein